MRAVVYKGSCNRISNLQDPSINIRLGVSQEDRLMLIDFKQ